MLLRLARACAVLWRAHGFQVRPLRLGAWLLGHRLVTEVGLLLDHVVAPAWRQRRVERPVFLVGAPFSGTTFLHEALVAHGVGVGFDRWGLLVPSLAWRGLLRARGPRRAGWVPAAFSTRPGGGAALDRLGSEDALSFFRHLGGPWMYAWAWAWAEEDPAPALRRDLEASAERDLASLRAALRRNLQWHGADRAIARLSAASVRPDALFTTFPDAVMVYVVREPVDVVASALRVASATCAAGEGGAAVDPAVRARYLRHVYTGIVTLYRAFADAWAAGRLPRGQVLVLRYERMMADFEGTMREVCAATGWTPDAAQWRAIRETAAAQRRHQAAPGASLAEAGLTVAQIREDCAFVYATFGLTPKRRD